VELVKPVAEIDVVTAETAFGEYRCDFGSEYASAFGCRVDHHAR
jgi:hypothetical protein